MTVSLPRTASRRVKHMAAKYLHTPPPSPTKKSLARSFRTGTGTPKDPFCERVAEEANRTGCLHCPSARCPCVAFGELLADTFESLERKRIVCAKRELCAKSILPPFVTRLIRDLSITNQDTFFDLGCGNGSVMFQVAFLTGARCIGVELSVHNAQVARDAWARLRPKLEVLAGRSMPDVTIITGDIQDIVTSEFFSSTQPVIWTANLLMPKFVSHHMSEVFRTLPVGTRIACFDDLYPHSRTISRLRDPEIYDLFEMTDYTWSSGTVEWTHFEGPYYSYKRI